MTKILLPNGELIERKPFARNIGNYCQLYVRFKDKVYAIGNGDEYIRGIPDAVRLNYLASGDQPQYILYDSGDGNEHTRGTSNVFKLNYLVGGEKPQYILYPEHSDEMEKNPSMKVYYKDYIELSC